MKIRWCFSVPMCLFRWRGDSGSIIYIYILAGGCGGDSSAVPRNSAIGTKFQWFFVGLFVKPEKCVFENVFVCQNMAVVFGTFDLWPHIKHVYLCYLLTPHHAVSGESHQSVAVQNFVAGITEGFALR